MEQFERTKRYLEKIREIYFGVFSSSGHDCERYEDEIISFFIHCYHIRDWIIHLNRVAITAKDVDEYINKHIQLKICADLANGSKHCRLTKTTRTGSQPHIAGRERKASTWFTGNGGGEVIQAKYTVLSGQKTYDALDLAEQSVQLWSDFINEVEADNNANADECLCNS